MSDTPALSIVVGTRESSAIDHVLEPLLPQLEAVGGELIVVGARPRTTERPVRYIESSETDLMHLRWLGLRAARGDVVAIGEDHAPPTPNWCESLLRAHREHPDSPAVSGCLENVTVRTMSARANFIAFAAGYAPPMRSLPSRPPPVSTMSFKRAAVAEIAGPGDLESQLIPELFAQGRIAADDRILLTHAQDFSIWWAACNGFHSARSGYGYLSRTLDRDGRRRVLRWIARHMLGEQWRASREALSKVTHRSGDLAVVLFIELAACAGAVAGTLWGPGRSPSRVA